MGILRLPTFDTALADSARLAQVATVARQAIGFCEAQLGKIEEPTAERDPMTTYAMNCGLLEASVEVLVAYLAQIKGICTPDPMPGLDDLGGAA